MKIIYASALPAFLLLAGCGEDTSATAEKPEDKAHAESSENPATLPEAISFNEHIQPILSEYCYHCHGPDSGTRRPDKEPLRLDIEAEAFKIRKFGSPVIIKGESDESYLMELIKSTDKSEVMPPKESHKVMKPREIALIEKWIEQGAKYEGHWSYQPVVRLDPPKNDWSKQPIDGFVYEKLAQARIKPNKPEDPRRFHRRLSFDLTGLPPEPTATDAFVAAYAKNPDAAVSAEADRMLETIASAEHFARHWLDAARYADTHGIHIDNYRAIWPYRDWVVQAFHQNMKWDQFTTEQLAGDMLPDRTLDQHVATGFLRSLATTGEGGAIDEEYNAIYATDRVDTMSGIWLGLTASCASCHDHKFDPFSTKEFYQFTAFFRNNTMSALDGNKADHPPTVFVPFSENKEKLAQPLKDLDGRIAARRKAAEGDYKKWLATAGQTKAQVPDSTLAIHLPLTESEGNIKGKVDGQPKEWTGAPARIDGPLGKAITVSGNDIPLGDIGNFSVGDQVSYGGFIRIDGNPATANGAVIAKMDPANGHRGWDLWLEGGRPGAHVIGTWQSAANKIVSPTPLTPGTWHHVMLVFDGKLTGSQATSLYVDGKQVAANPEPNTVSGTLNTTVPLRLGSREAGASKLTGNVALQDFRFYKMKLSEVEIALLASNKTISTLAAIPAASRTPAQNTALFEHFINAVDAPSIELLREKAKLNAEAAVGAKGTTSLVFEEKKGELPFAHVLERGSYTAKGEKVFPNTPAMLLPMPEDAPKNRLGLAKWLNDPKNPLPPRVTMNRLWANFFGVGIVETAGDFGIMGARPTHPKLLDWLAAEFISSGWDYRHMAKTIATSHAYRQASTVTPEKLEKDYSNTLISRGPRLRLDAEQIRDLALAASGSLSPKVGGAPVKPYQPVGVWEAVGMKECNTKDYKQDTGEALYRRSIYTFWKRTAAPPTMEILDAPTRETFCLQRGRSNTPLQALALMNDPQFVETSRNLAAKALAEKQGFDERLDFISLRLLNRKFIGADRAQIKSTLEAALENYTAKPEDARLSISTGESKAPATIPVPELAAWSLLTSLLFNLDETVTR